MNDQAYRRELAISLIAYRGEVKPKKLLTGMELRNPNQDEAFTRYMNSVQQSLDSAKQKLGSVAQEIGKNTSEILSMIYEGVRKAWVEFYEHRYINVLIVALLGVLGNGLLDANMSETVVDVVVTLINATIAYIGIITPFLAVDIKNKVSAFIRKARNGDKKEMDNFVNNELSESPPPPPTQKKDKKVGGKVRIPIAGGGGVVKSPIAKQRIVVRRLLELDSREPKFFYTSDSSPLSPVLLQPRLQEA